MDISERRHHSRPPSEIRQEEDSISYPVRRYVKTMIKPGVKFLIVKFKKHAGRHWATERNRQIQKESAFRKKS